MKACSFTTEFQFELYVLVTILSSSCIKTVFNFHHFKFKKMKVYIAIQMIFKGKSLPSYLLDLSVVWHALLKETTYFKIEFMS